ncbi:MAG: hypothetical protein J6O41_08320, partial [Clostridia bacterium]|nr:hypothetical protein [Clostridia bacterium]
LFPMASIYRHKTNRGADYNMWYLYHDFLKSDDEIFFNADSDIIFSKGWLEKGLSLLDKTDGCLSLFNTANHMNISIGDELVENLDVGAACVLFKRDVLESIMDMYSSEDVVHFDFQWSEFLKKNGLKIYATKSSFIQHIGFTGKNSGIKGFDYGDGFIIDSVFNGQVINNAVEEYYKKLGHKNFIRSSLEYRIGYYVLWPFRLPVRFINKIKRIYKDSLA